MNATTKTHWELVSDIQAATTVLLDLIDTQTTRIESLEDDLKQVERQSKTEEGDALRELVESLHDAVIRRGTPAHAVLNALFREYDLTGDVQP